MWTFTQIRVERRAVQVQFSDEGNRHGEGDRDEGRLRQGASHEGEVLLGPGVSQTFFCFEICRIVGDKNTADVLTKAMSMTGMKQKKGPLDDSSHKPQTLDLGA